MREEAAAQPSGWLAWLRRPVVAAAAMVLVAVGVGMLEVGQLVHGPPYTWPPMMTASGVSQLPRTAVSDLQYLDKNADLFSEFDALDGQSSTE